MSVDELTEAIRQGAYPYMLRAAASDNEWHAERADTDNFRVREKWGGIARAALGLLHITPEAAKRGVNVGRAVGLLQTWCREDCESLNMLCNECPVRVALCALGEVDGA